MTIQERLSEVEHRLKEILHSYRHDAHPLIFALRDEALELLRPRNLIKKMQISSRYVVVHPQNRYGDGIVPSQAHKLIDSFALNGFSTAEVGMPLASEMPPTTSPRHAEIIKFNNDIVANSNGALPPIAEDDYIIMSVAKSHSSMGSRCVLLGAPHENQKITEDGLLSLQRIRALRPEYADAIECGFEWEVVSWRAEEAFPSLMDLLQEAGNLAQATCMDETRWQVALKMCSSMLRLSQTTKMSASEISECVGREAARGGHKFTTELGDLSTYVQHMAGDKGALLHEIVAFAKTLKHPRIVTGPVLAAISRATLGADGHSAIGFRQDLIKAMVSASDKYCKVDGAQNLVDNATIKSLTQDTKHKMVMLVEKMKTKAIELLQEHEVERTPQVDTALNIFGVRMVHHVLKKPDPTRGIYKSLHDIGHAFGQDVANLTGKAFGTPWTPTCARAPAQGQSGDTAAPQVQGGLKPIAADGTISKLRIFEREGLLQGAHVKHSKTKTTYCITEVKADDQVTLEAIDAREGDIKTVEIDSSAFLRAVKSYEYQLTSVSSKPTSVVAEWATSANPMLTYEWKANLKTAEAFVELDRVAKAHRNTALGDLLDVVYAPLAQQGVFAKKDIASGAACIVPLTTTLLFKESPQEDAVDLGVKLQTPLGRTVSLTMMRPKFQLPKEGEGDAARGVYTQTPQEGFVAHFWKIREADDQNVANMFLTTLPDSYIPILKIARKSKLVPSC